MSVLVDGSASMLQPRGNGRFQAGWGMAAALLGAWTVAGLCNELQIDFEVSIFNRSFAAREQDTEWSYTRSLSQSTAGLKASHGQSAQRLTTTVNHYLIKPFDKRWAGAEEVLAGMLWTASAPREAAVQARKSPRTAPPVSMFDKAANVDELNVIHAARRLAAQGAETRLLMVLADGMTRGIGPQPGQRRLLNRKRRRHRVGNRHRRRHRGRCLPAPSGGSPPRGTDQGDGGGNQGSPAQKPGQAEGASGMSGSARFPHPSGKPEREISLSAFGLPADLADYSQRRRKIPDPDPYYVDLGMLYRFAALEKVHRLHPPGYVPLHIAVRGHMGTGKDHDIEQLAARLRLPYYRIPMTGEVRDLTLIGSTRLHGDGKGGTESRWETVI